MKKLMLRFLSFFMAGLLLFSTLSFTLNMHYCGETLVATSVFSATQGCGMENNEYSNSECYFSQKKCCSEITLAFEGQDKMQMTDEKITFHQHHFATTLASSIHEFFGIGYRNPHHYPIYLPPLIAQSIFKLEERYLI